MKCRKQFRFHKLPISNLWEVHLDPEIWERLKRVSEAKKCSISWISRYCVFRIARRKVIKIPVAMEILSNELRKTYHSTPKTHRHMMCLYGEDEKLLRIAAMELNMTVSHLIRLAIYRYLPKVEKESFDWRFIYYYGTRICRYLDITRVNQKKIPYYDHVFFTKWPIESWWRRPFPFLPIPYTPDAATGPSWLYAAMDPEIYQGVFLKWYLTR